MTVDSAPTPSLSSVRPTEGGRVLTGVGHFYDEDEVVVGRRFTNLRTGPRVDWRDVSLQRGFSLVEVRRELEGRDESFRNP